MRKIWIICCVLLPCISFAQVPNLGMESWRTSTAGDSTPVSVEAPDSWYGSDSLIIALGQSPIASSYLRTHDSDWRRQIFVETNIVHGGTHCAKIMTMKEDTLFLPGVISNAVLNLTIITSPPYISGAAMSGGSAVTVKPVTISAWVKYLPGKDTTGNTGIDSGRISVQTLAHINGIDSVIGMGTVTIKPDTGWALVTDTITYTDEIHPVDAIRIAFASSSGSVGLDSSTLYVDDISMRSVPNPPPVIDAGIGTVAVADQVKLYPNPSCGHLYADVTLNKDLLYRMYSLSGQIVREQAIRSGVNEIDVSLLADGFYFYEVRDDAGIIQRGKVTLGK